MSDETKPTQPEERDRDQAHDQDPKHDPDPEQAPSDPTDGADSHPSRLSPVVERDVSADPNAPHVPLRPLFATQKPVVTTPQPPTVTTPATQVVDVHHEPVPPASQESEDEEDEGEDIGVFLEEIFAPSAGASDPFTAATTAPAVSDKDDDDDDDDDDEESEVDEDERGLVTHVASPPSVVHDPPSAVLPAREPDPASVDPLDTTGLPIDEQGVARLLTQLGLLAAECGSRSLAAEIEEERLPALSRGRITLVVLGEFNHGKSTVINALLGDEVLPMGITPTTAVITHLTFAPEPTVTIQPPHRGKPYTIPYVDMERAVRESGAEGEEPEYVEIGYPNEVLQRSLVLVDTPGVNDISRQKVEITYGYLPRADVILYVLDATQVLKKSEVTFIRDRLLKANRDRIIFVLNKIDALSPEDIEEVEQYARERLTALLGPVELFTFSGRQALNAIKRGQPTPQAFQDFQVYLRGFLQEQRAYIILDSALAGGLRVSSLLNQNLSIKRQGYSLERDELERRIVAVRSRLNESRRLIAENTQLIDTRIQGIAATARHNLRIFTEQFVEQLPLQIERADAGDVKKFLPGWIQDAFKGWLEDEGRNLARSLEELAEEIIQTTNESLQQAVRGYHDEFGLAGELNLDVDTIAYDVGVFALGAFGVASFFLFANIIVGSLLTLATPILAYFLKEKIEAKIKERAREQGVEAVQTASQKLEDELLRIIHDYGDRLKSFVETAGDRLYRQIEEALEQVQDETRGDFDREALLTHTDARLANIQSLLTQLTDARAALATWAASRGF